MAGYDPKRNGHITAFISDYSSRECQSLVIPQLEAAKDCHCEQSEAISQTLGDCHGLTASQ
jgi:hypothetical protein